MRLLCNLFLLFLVKSVSAQTCEPPSTPIDCESSEFQSCSIVVGGMERTYCQHVPNQGGDLPVIFSYHGAGGKSKALVNLWRGHTEQSMVLIVPDAVETRSGGNCSLRWRQLGNPAKSWADMNSIDDCTGGALTADLDFTAALLEKMQNERDVKNFYALGFSNGGGFVYQLYMTHQLAEKFSGFAAAGAGMTGPKIEAMKSQRGAGKYTSNTDIKRPFLFQMGTQDKKNIPLEVIAHAVDNNPACLPITSAKQVMNCFYFTHVDKAMGVYDMPTRRSLTRDWLVNFNKPDQNRHEGLYPNLGIGAAPFDHTMTIREDYNAHPKRESAAVSVLTTIDGGHDWPGWGGNRAPCPSMNCDVDLLQEILQFWRAHAGLRLPLP